MSCLLWKLECSDSGVNLRIVLIGLLLTTSCNRKAAPEAERRVTREVIDDALRNARASHKTLMVEFGADWCSDCRILAKQLGEQPVQHRLDDEFVRLKIDVGEFNRNLDTAASLGVDIKNGVIPT